MVRIIAEAGVNHNGDVNIAHNLIDAAVETGVDAIKFQTFIAEETVSQAAPLANHHIANTGTELTHFELIKKLELPFDSFKKLKDYCSQKNIYFISTPYDLISAKFLINLNVSQKKFRLLDCDFCTCFFSKEIKYLNFVITLIINVIFYLTLFLTKIQQN